MATVTLATLEALRTELVKSKYYLNIRSGYMAPVTLHCSYGDSGQEVTFYIFDGSSTLDLTGATVSIHGIRKDGANFGPFSCTTDGNAVTFSIQSAMTAVEGGSIAEFVITKSNTTIGTCNFGILVENAAFPNGVSYDTDPSVYYDILKYVQQMDSIITNRVDAHERSTSTQIANHEAAVSTRMTNHEATVATQISDFETEVNNTVSQIIASSGNDNTEIVNARMIFDGTSKSTLKLRLNQFLEYDNAGTTDNAGAITSLSEEIIAAVADWLNTHPANLVYAKDGTLAFYVIETTEDING